MYVTTRTIAELVALETGVPLADILGRSRARPVTQARQLTCWLARRSAPKRRSYPVIARNFESMCHTAVMHACRAAALRVRTLPWWRDTAPRLLGTVMALQAGDAGAVALLAAMRSESPELRERRCAGFTANHIRAAEIVGDRHAELWQ